MRYVRDIPHPVIRAGLYAWNGKYILKLEAGLYEQTYKISELDVASEDEVVALLDAPFLDGVATRFRQMHDDFTESCRRHGVDG